MDEYENLYDEFGNYIGPDLSEGENSGVMSDSSDDDENGDTEKASKPFVPKDIEDAESLYDGQDPSSSHANRAFEGSSVVALQSAHSQEIVLHEDKQYFPPASAIYPDAEILTQLEDTQPIEQPIIAPIKNRLFCEIEKNLPETSFSYKYMTKMMENPSLIRNICFLGQLHHGKTLFMDMLVKETHLKNWHIDKEVRYTDTGKDEQERGVSIKASPMSLVLETTREKSYLLNIMDCPGHVNFSDEQTAAIRISDGAVIFVDCIEGVMKQTTRSIQHAIEQGLSIVVVLTKFDRLILELKLPPNDAYHKLVGLLKEINSFLYSLGSNIVVSPERGNVCFSSGLFGWSFTLDSFSQWYFGLCKKDEINTETFVRSLWGDKYFDKKTRRFVNKAPSSDSRRSFVEFVLEPVYKIYSIAIGTDPKKLEPFLESLAIKLKKKELQWDSKPLIKLICTKFFKRHGGFVDMIVKHFSDPVSAAKWKIPKNYTGNLNSECAKFMLKCQTFQNEGEDKDSLKRAPTMINIVKIYPRPDCSSFDAFGRVFSGIVRKGDTVRVLREGYSLDDDEDMCVKTIEDIWIYQGRYRVSINQVTAGNWALFSGIDTGITKTATITQVEGNDDACIFRPLKFNSLAVMKVAIEPLKPSELPKMLEALRHINNTYPISHTKVEESGEHILLGTGELYMDCMLHDMREKYSDIEIKVADPVVRFAETVLETSSIPCFAHTPNQQNKITIICEPLDPKISNDIENEAVDINWDPTRLSKHFQNNYNWDVLAARSIWAFGPDNNGPNVLLDDTLPSETDKSKLSLIKSSIVQGFQWGTREGPLCDEPIRNCRFKIVDAEVSDNPLHRGGGQIIPTARRVAYSAFLLATPRLMEPIYFVEIQAPIDCIAPIYNVLGLRRGFVVSETPKPGTPMFIIHAHIPVIDSFGFETDLRTHTQGQAFCTSVFDHWEQVPGDPLDKSIVIKPLEASPTHALAREFMTKTRQRKGLEEDVTAYKFFDDAMLFALAEHEADQEE